MTVSSSASRNQYTATAGQTVFAYTFEIVSDDDIVVLKNGVTLTKTADYTVSGVGTDSGGNVTLVVGATAGDILTLYRAMAYERLTDYTNAGDFLAADVNNDFDRLWIATQQVNEEVNRSLKAPVTDPLTIDMTIPAKADRLNKILRFNATTGNPEVINLASGATSATNVSFTQAGTGAVERTVETKLNESISVKDFGADPTGSTDSTAAIQAALDYAYQNKSSDSFNPGSGPTRSVGQLTVYIPTGKYVISSPLLVYGGTRVIGDGVSGTVIITNTVISSVFSLVGVSYGALTQSINTQISQLSINGNYKADFGITNAITEHPIVNSELSGLFISNCLEVGLFITGGWASLYQNIATLNNNIGVIFGRNSSGNGFNLNSVIRVDAQSCNRIGMYLDTQTCFIANPNIDKIGTSWLPNPNFDVSKTFSYNGIDYTQVSGVEINHPIGLYITGITRDTVVQAPWFEFVYTASGTAVAVELNGTETYGSGLPLMGGNEVNQVHIGAQVDIGYNVQWSQVKLTAPFLDNATTKLTLGSSQHAGVILDAWYYVDVNSITTADTQNRIKSINTRGFDSGIIDEYYVESAQSGKVERQVFNAYSGGGVYSNEVRTNWDPTVYRISKDVSHYTGGATTDKKSLVYRGDLSGLGYVAMPQNVGAFTVPAGASSIVVTFATNITSRDTYLRPAISLNPRDQYAAALFGGGWYTNNFTATTFTVQFLTTQGTDAVFGFFATDNDGYNVQ